MSKPLLLDSFFSIVETKINSETLLFERISFNFNQKKLMQILNAKDQNQPVKISDSLLNQLRYYCLIDQYQSYNLQSSLNFITHFDSINQNKPLLKTTINLDGNILNQICDRCLEDEKLIFALTTAHYWLIEQILQAIKFQFQPVKVKQIIQNIAWIIAIIIILITVVFSIQNFLNNWLLWIAPIIACFLLQWGIQKLLWLNLRYFRTWLLKQTLYGMFSRQRKQQSKILNILSHLG